MPVALLSNGKRVEKCRVEFSLSHFLLFVDTQCAEDHTHLHLPFPKFEPLSCGPPACQLSPVMCVPAPSSDTISSVRFY